jgi:integrase
VGTKIETVTARAKLKPRREPYWHRVSKGCYLGFRKMTADSEGSWTARALDERTGKQAYKALGEFGALPDHQRFDAARKDAEQWFEHLGRGGSIVAQTVKDACGAYVKHVRGTKGDKAADDAKARFDNYVLDDPKLASTELAKLTPAHLEAWRDQLRERETKSGPRRGQKRTASTLNRDMTCFRAALNLAYKDGHVTSDFAWRGKLLPLKGVDQRRELYLDRAQRKRFIAKAPPDLAAFLRGLAMLPLRPGALAGLIVGDFDRRLKVLKIGKDKAGGDRKIKLPEATAALFTEASKDKLPTALLFARADGIGWHKDAWKGPVKEAAQAAKLPPGTTAYTLRHSTISDLVHDGLDLLTVAQISGTSVRMIEQHYGHLRGTVAAAALAKLAL